MRRRSPGYSLLEAIIASFLLVFTFFLVSRLFQTGLQYSSKVEARMTAIQAAEKRMSEIRLWAQNAKTWSGYPTGPDDQFPGYTINVRIEPNGNTIYSPSSELERAFGSDRRAMDTVARKFVVTVSKQGQAPFVLPGVVLRGEPSWNDDCEIRISPQQAMISGAAQEVRFTAKAFDAEGDEIKDVFFHWEVEPADAINPSTAEVRYDTRDGRSVKVRNRIRQRPGVWVAQNGSARIIAYIRWKGGFRRGGTQAITLVAPP